MKKVVTAPPSATGSRIYSIVKEGAVNNASGKVADPPSTTGGDLGNASGIPVTAPENVPLLLLRNTLINGKCHFFRCSRRCS